LVFAKFLAPRGKGPAVSDVHNDDTAGLSLEDMEGPFGKYYGGTALPAWRCIDVRPVLDLEHQAADDEARRRWQAAVRLARLARGEVQ
jgi:hypothetical protein